VLFKLSVTFLAALPSVTLLNIVMLCAMMPAVLPKKVPNFISKLVTKPKHQKYFISGKKNNSFVTENSRTYFSSVKKFYNFCTK
jgi:hypothetical protein